VSGVFEVHHPLVECHLAQLRDAATTPTSFRAHVRRLATLLAYEATQDLRTVPIAVRTPLVETTGAGLSERVGLVPILRAGLGMIDPVLDLIPTAEVWHLGLYRDEATAAPVEYYSKLPPGRPVDVALVLDPMLATGGSVTAALETLHAWGVQRTKVVSIIASAEGVENVSKQFPQTQLFVCKIDAELNANKFIVPGLGDAGDRIFNTPG
jgi:uracil phosphoribosyltransferase